ncbi:MAG: hypothetical protein HY903_04535 [Deltaproteobacteria bacterium]|nr:hypothetical protein [Deltaproteobacteria bacterium]
MSPTPFSIVRRTDAEDVARDVAGAAGTTMDDRARILEELCRMAAEQIAQHPDPKKALAWRDPLPPGSEALLARLRARFRHG